jgi:hypothetical protein
MAFDHIFQRIKTLAAIGFFPARARLIDLTYAATRAFFGHVRFGFFVAKGVTDTQDHG